MTLFRDDVLPQIPPPPFDVDGNTITCEPPDCSLHFHMSTSAYARLGVYSTESAPGIIVAHGEGGREGGRGEGGGGREGGREGEREGREWREEGKGSRERQIGVYGVRRKVVERLREGMSQM